MISQTLSQDNRYESWAQAHNPILKLKKSLCTRSERDYD